MAELDVFDAGDVCAYAQQAAEKAIKAVLIDEADVVPRMHDLCALRSRSTSGIAVQIADEMLVRVSAQWISSRYPGDWTEPTAHDAQTALHVASAVVADATRIIMEQERDR